MLLVRCPLIGVSWRHGDPVDADLRDLVEEASDALRLGCVEQGRIDVDTKATGLRQLDRRDSAIVNTLLTHQVVVLFAVAIEMDRPGEISAGFEQLDFFLEQQRVGAEVNELLLRRNALDNLDNLVDLPVQQRFAPRDHHHRCTTFTDGPEAFIDAQALIEDGVRVVDLSATGAGEVAAEERLEHQNERIAPDTPQMLPDNIGSYSDRLVQRDRHRVTSSRNYDSEPISEPDRTGLSGETPTATK